MKKLVILLVLLLAAGYLFAQETGKPAADWHGTLAFGFPTVSLGMSYNDDGAITAVRGLNLGIGYSAKHYLKPLVPNTFTPFWHWGTLAIIVPYIGVGADYVTQSGFYFTIGTLYLAPYIGFGLYF